MYQILANQNRGNHTSISYIQKVVKAEKYVGKNGKALYNTIYAVYDKSLENMRKIVDVRISSNGKEYLKETSKPSLTNQHMLECAYQYQCMNFIIII